MSGFTGSVGAAYSSARHDWATPQALFEELDAEFGFTLDAAASPWNAKCAQYFTEADDGLAQDWGGERVFCNPPYGREIAKWVANAAEEAHKPGTTVVLLVPARTDTAWFHDHLLGRAELRFLRGRLRFEGAKHNAPFPSMVAVLR